MPCLSTHSLSGSHVDVCVGFRGEIISSIIIMIIIIQLSYFVLIHVPSFLPSFLLLFVIGFEGLVSSVLTSLCV